MKVLAFSASLGVFSLFGSIAALGNLTPQTVDDSSSRPLVGASIDGKAVTPTAELDWAGLRAARDAQRYEAALDPANDSGVWKANNPGQHWSLAFDGKSCRVDPDHGKWTWGMALQSYGFGGCEQGIQEQATISSSGNRTNYQWNAALQEWFVNEGSGLEHGFTLMERPERESGSTGPLLFTLQVLGDLDPVIQAKGHDILFLDEQGGMALGYSGLRVFDSLGRDQEASFKEVGGHIQISIDERGALYPLTIDPIAQQAYLKATNSDAGDFFGGAIAISGDTVVIAAFAEDSHATGTNGSQANNNALDSGAVYVFVRNGGTWIQQAYIKASNSQAGDAFGFSVAISGDTLVIGSPGEDSNADGVNGNQQGNTAPDAGAAYVYVRNGIFWSQQAYLKASNSDTIDRFGRAVDVSEDGDTIIVGAPNEDSASVGVNGNQLDNSASVAGAAYVFVRDSQLNWSQQAYLKASNTGPQDSFGEVLSLSGSTVAISSYEENSSSSGVNGNQFNNGTQDAGAVYVFKNTSGVWAQEAYIKASNPDAFDRFGLALALHQNRLVVGAPFEDSAATVINGAQDNNALDTGAAYVFSRTGTTWMQTAYLKPSNSGDSDLFGVSVDVDGDTIAVGSAYEDSLSTGINGDPFNNDAVDAGAAYLFDRVPGGWAQTMYLKASNPNPDDGFGRQLAISPTMVVVGALWEDSDTNGINGDQGNLTAVNAGSAYAFDRTAPVATYCGEAGVNSTGQEATLDVQGSLLASANTFSLRADNLPASVNGFFLSSIGQGFLANPGGSQGNLCLGGGEPIGRHNSSLQNSGAQGVILHGFDLTNMPTNQGFTVALAGETWNFQLWHRDMNPGPTSNFSQAITVQFQ